MWLLVTAKPDSICLRSLVPRYPTLFVHRRGPHLYPRVLPPNIPSSINARSTTWRKNVHPGITSFVWPHQHRNGRSCFANTTWANKGTTPLRRWIRSGRLGKFKRYFLWSLKHLFIEWFSVTNGHSSSISSHNKSVTSTAKPHSEPMIHKDLQRTRGTTLQSLRSSGKSRRANEGVQHLQAR